MDILRSDRVCYFDVDETLILWVSPEEAAQNENSIRLEHNGEERHIVPHSKHVQAVKDFKFRGQGVVVWSQGGYKWAAKVVQELKLEKYVDLVLCKPAWIFDDKDPEEWLGKRYYEDV